MIEYFEDKNGGGYYISASDAERLIVRLKESYDGAVPSGNSVAAMVLEKLSSLTGETIFREAADRQQKYMAGQMKRYPSAHCFCSDCHVAKPVYPSGINMCLSFRTY